MKIRQLVLLLAVSMVTTSLYAQIQLSLNADPNPNPKIYEWIDRTESVVLTITNTDPSLEGTRYRIRFSLLLDGTMIANNTLSATPVREIINGIEVLYADEALAMSAVNLYGVVKEQVARTGMLPAGVYTLCLSLVDLNGTPIAQPSEVCRPMVLTDYQRPELIWPAAGASIKKELLPGTTFTWSPMIPAPPAEKGVKYLLVITEVEPQQSPGLALLVNNPLVEMEVTGSTSVTLPPDLEPVSVWGRLVWSVKPMTLEGEPWFTENAGFSPPVLFNVDMGNGVDGDDSGQSVAKEIRYRFVVAYSEGVSEGDAIDLATAIGKGFQSLTILSGKPNDYIASDANASGSGGSPDNEEGQQAESLFRMLTSEPGLLAGPGITVISAKPEACPPNPCGCKKDNTVTFACNCTKALGWCMCPFCAIYSEMTPIEVDDDITLTIGGRVVPPVNTDSVEVRDVIVMLMSPGSKTWKDIRPGILKGAETVYTHRAAKKNQAKAIVVKY